MIDDRRDLVTRADFHELRRHLCLFPDVDRNDLVREPSFLEHHSGLVAVVRRPGVAIDHSFLPMKRLSEVCRIYPELRRLDNSVRATRYRTILERTETGQRLQRACAFSIQRHVRTQSDFEMGAGLIAELPEFCANLARPW